MKKTTMRSGEVIEKLRKEGFSASVGRLRQAMLNGHIEPLPQKGSRGSFDFQPEHLQMLRRYFVEIRPGPKPLFPVKWPIRGSHDRLHRLAKKKQQLAVRRSERAACKQRREATDETIRWVEALVDQLDS